MIHVDLLSQNGTVLAQSSRPVIYEEMMYTSCVSDLLLLILGHPKVSIKHSTHPSCLCKGYTTTHWLDRGKPAY